MKVPFNLLIPWHLLLLVGMLFIATSNSLAQNLIINGDFELGNTDCQASIFKIDSNVSDWSTTNIFSVYHRQNCATNSLVFPHSGNGHIGILGNAWVSGFIDGSILKGKLVTPLEAGKTYVLEFYGKSTGFRQDEDFSSKICPFNPPHAIAVHLGGTEEIFEVEKTFDESTLFITGSNVINTYNPITFPQPIIIQSTPDTVWTKYTACYRAIGDETQIAISSTIRPFEETLPCEIIDANDFIEFEENPRHQIFSFEIDDISLYELPEAIEKTEITCQNELAKFDLFDYLPENSLPFETATLYWPDGSEIIENELEEEGIYNIEVRLTCTSIPLTVNLIRENCLQPFFIPNIFSPNNDGINDEFQPLLSSHLTLESYQLVVYNRWGSQVFSTTNNSQAWNGEFNNKRFVEGTFFWAINYKLVGVGMERQLTGTVSLIR